MNYVSINNKKAISFFKERGYKVTIGKLITEHPYKCGCCFYKQERKVAFIEIDISAINFKDLLERNNLLIQVQL